MNLVGKEINYIFIFTAVQLNTVSFTCECDAAALAAPVTCHQWTSQVFSDSILCGYCRSLRISVMLITASESVTTRLTARSCYLVCNKEAHNTLKSLDNFKKYN